MMTKQQRETLAAIFTELHDKAESQLNIDHTSYAASVLAEAAFLAVSDGIPIRVFLAAARRTFECAIQRMVDAQDSTHPRN